MCFSKGLFPIAICNFLSKDVCGLGKWFVIASNLMFCNGHLGMFFYKLFTFVCLATWTNNCIKFFICLFLFDLVYHFHIVGYIINSMESSSSLLMIGTWSPMYEHKYMDTVCPLGIHQNIRYVSFQFICLFFFLLSCFHIFMFVHRFYVLETIITNQNKIWAKL